MPRRRRPSKKTMEKINKASRIGKKPKPKIGNRKRKIENV